MAFDVSIVEARARPPETMPANWKFAFTTGYGMWALCSGSHGEARQVPTVPWEVVLEIRYNSGRSSFRYKQIGDHHNLIPDIHDAPFEHGCDLRLSVWTTTQSLYVPGSSGAEVLLKFAWEKQFTHLCGYFTLLESGYYD